MIKWPAKDCDYDSGEDYTPDTRARDRPSVEQFKKGQYVCAVQKNDGLGYAMFKVHEVDCSVTALLRGPHDTAVLKSYPPGMYTLVEYCKLMPGVCFIFLTPAFTSGFCNCTYSRACLGQTLYNAIRADKHFPLSRTQAPDGAGDEGTALSLSVLL
jgi:hypothetical protein